MKYGLPENTINVIHQVFVLFPEVEKVLMYGSRAKGNFKNGSDIDLSLVGEKLTLSLQNKIESAIDALLLPYTFDFSIFHQISNPDLISHIERVGIVFYQKK
ncbi:MAG: nucleotidyltransferase domain-containing protein [Bacteroidales bacterium]